VMYAGINVASWGAAFYFISFVLLVTIIFANLFQALFIDARSFRPH